VTVQEPKLTELSILTHHEAAEGVSDVLLELGANGVAEEIRPLNVRITAYLPQDDQLEGKVRQVRERLAALERQGLRIGPGTIGVRTLQAKAWSEAWKDHFQLLKIPPGLVIAPTWEEYEPTEGEFVVCLEPGSAFGTGGHATTRLCLRALVAHMRPGDRVADVGCGSGILAISAVALGARQVVAVDNDRTALSVAQSNARRNGVEDAIVFSDSDLLSTAVGTFEVIVCNIVAEEVIRLAAQLPALLARGGRCITSGFLNAGAPRVEDALARAGLQILETIGEEGWAACIAVRPGRGR
jgi:ribosomal protein L11 methyltransferase